MKALIGKLNLGCTKNGCGLRCSVFVVVNDVIVVVFFPTYTLVPNVKEDMYMIKRGHWGLAMDHPHRVNKSIVAVHIRQHRRPQQGPEVKTTQDKENASF